MRKFASYIIFTLLLAAIACACSDDIDIRQGYEFQVAHLPVPKKIKKGETVEIRCQLEKTGDYQETKYTMRYFQTDGEGSLRLGNNDPFLPNDLYELKDESFRLYYTSHSEEQAVIDIYFFNSEGNSFTLNFTFNNSSDKEEES